MVDVWYHKKDKREFEVPAEKDASYRDSRYQKIKTKVCSASAPRGRSIPDLSQKLPIYP
jgi:hypothetical protein